MTRKKPWNRVSLPVYSISSQAGNVYNMNIITYVTAISMKPKRFACCIYEGTRTLELVASSGRFVLQILSAGQYRLVKLLGMQSGHDIDKLARLQKRGLLTNWNGYPVLSGALALMELSVISSMDGGDHRLFICDLVAWKNQQEGDTLTLDILREKKLVRI